MIINDLHDYISDFTLTLNHRDRLSVPASDQRQFPPGPDGKLRGRGVPGIVNLHGTRMVSSDNTLTLVSFVSEPVSHLEVGPLDCLSAPVPGVHTDTNLQITQDTEDQFQAESSFTTSSRRRASSFANTEIIEN